MWDIIAVAIVLGSPVIGIVSIICLCIKNYKDHSGYVLLEYHMRDSIWFAVKGVFGGIIAWIIAYGIAYYISAGAVVIASLVVWGITVRIIYLYMFE